MNKKICNECGTENEIEYTYCKNCGVPISTTESVDENNQDYEQKSSNDTGAYERTTQTNPNNAQSFNVDGIDGVPREEIELFIGRKAYEIMPKFSKMELSATKVSWCWPAAILGFLFGPLGSALWFFYRKMYKPAVILSVIGAVITFITAFMTMGTDSAAIDAIFSAFTSGDPSQITSAIEGLDTPATALDMVAGLIDDITCTASGIICGLFGYYIYKNHCVNKILSFRSVQINQGYYHLGLPAIGGVSGGMLAVGIIIMISINNLATVLTSLFSILI